MRLRFALWLHSRALKLAPEIEQSVQSQVRQIVDANVQAAIRDYDARVRAQLIHLQRVEEMARNN